MKKLKKKSKSKFRPTGGWALLGATGAAAMALITGGLALAADHATTAPATAPTASSDEGRFRFFSSSTPGVQSAQDVAFAPASAMTPMSAMTPTAVAPRRSIMPPPHPAELAFFEEPEATPVAAIAAPSTRPVETLAAAATPARVRWEPTATAAQPVVTATTAKPKASLIRAGLTEPGKLALSTNRTAELRLTAPVKTVSVAQPEIADVQLINANILLVTAKRPGTTQLIAYDENNRSESFDVDVQIDLSQLRELIGKVAPGANIDVGVAADQIVLRGQAPNLLVAKQVGDVAAVYGRVQNFIEVAGAQTVSVQVQFAEVSRSVTNSLGVNWGFSDGTTVFGVQPGSSGGPFGLGAGDAGVNGTISVPSGPLAYDSFLRTVVGKTPIDIFIKALRDNSLLRVLQEPTLTTTSGEPASFLAGGQVAVPVPADNGSIGIEYKEYGIRLLLTPIVLGNGKIKLVMEAESSDLDYANGTTIQGAAVPGLRTRRVQNTVELGEGQTISVAGLLDNSVVTTKQSIPGLGDLPVIGSLFRSTRYQRKETELVVLITPRLSGALNPGQVPPLPGAGWRHPSELEQFALGDTGGNREADAVQDWNKNPSDRGTNAPARGMRTEDRISSANRPGHDPSQPAPTFLGDHGFAPAPARREGDAMASVKD